MKRRAFLAGALAAPAIAHAKTSLTYYSPLNQAARVSPQVHISYGQSWRSNFFTDFGTFGLNYKAPFALLTNNIGGPTFAPGPLPNSAGINLPGTISGVTTYQSTDVFAIGRCAIIALQTLRQQRGVTITPYIEFCAAYPGSTWQSGGGGGLCPGASFTGTLNSDTLTVTGLTGSVVVNQSLQGTGVASGTAIVADLGGGQYTVAVVQLVTDEALTTSGGAHFTGAINNGDTVGHVGNILTADPGVTGTISVGDTVSGHNVLANTKIKAQLTGTAGKDGTYSLTVGSSQTLSSRAMTTTGTSWTQQLAILSELQALIPPNLDVRGGVMRFMSPTFPSVGYTQGTAADNTQATKIANLTEMLQDYDALGLPGGPLKYYLGLPATISNATIINTSYYGTIPFCQTNAPGAGGTYSGRCFFSSCSYPWPFNGGDNIHTGNYGTTRWGEWEGYVKFLVEDLGVNWTPLWVKSTPVTVDGQNVRVTFDRPAGPDFVNGVLSFQNDPNDGLKDWPQKGFSVKRGGVDLTVTPVLPTTGTTVTLQIAEKLFHGNQLEVSYCWYGPGGPSPGPYTGVGGNLAMTGPTSVLYPNGYQSVAKTIDAWAVPFNQTVIV